MRNIRTWGSKGVAKSKAGEPSRLRHTNDKVNAMPNRILAFSSVLFSMYLPSAVVWFLLGPNYEWPYLLVLPGWLLSLFAFRHEEFELLLASIGTLGIVVGLTWLGSKGRWQLVAATAIAFLNSAFWAGLVYLFRHGVGYV
jgi:hypothetical protein